MCKKSIKWVLLGSVLMILSACGLNVNVITASSDFKTRKFVHWYTAHELDAINQCTDIFKTQLTSRNLDPKNNSYEENKYITDNFYKGNDYCYDLYEHRSGEISVLRSMFFRYHKKDGLAYEYATKAVENKRPNAITNMARYHLHMKEYKNAIKWFTKSYDMNKNPNSAYENGYIYDKYLQDYNSAVVWYKIAYVSNQPISSYDIAIMYDSQLKDHIEGIKWFRIAQKQGYTGMNFKIAEAYKELKEYDRASHYYQLSYNSDENTMAALELARMYGHEEVGKYSKAVRWYIKAYDDSGDSRLLSVIGDLYNFKLKRYSYASDWYVKAIDIGNKSVVMKLATMYEYKVKNYSQAIKYYKMAIDIFDNRLEAPNILGDILNKKLHRPLESITWYEISAQAGNPVAGYNLGRVYQLKLKDYEHAKFWFTLSAKLKNKKSALALAEVYRDNYKDYNSAHKWLSYAETLP